MPMDHVSKQYDLDLQAIRSKILLMGGLVAAQLRDAIASFQTGDLAGAERVIKTDEEVNGLEVALDDACSQLIVKRQPAANDLRTVMATLKIITDLERVGDEATKIARMARQLPERDTGGALNHYEWIRVMAMHSSELLQQALDMFSRMDEKQATTIIARDEVINHEFRSVVRTMITFMMEDPRTISLALDILWVAKALERIGDHAKSIAEYVIYIVEGKDIRHSDYAAVKVDRPV